MLFSFTRVTALSLVGVSCITASAAIEAFERLKAVPEGWRYDGTPDSNQPIRLRIALKQHDLDGFEQALLDMSTPGNSHYGQHYSDYDEMKELLLPSDDSLSSVKDWLSTSGIPELEEDADWINFRTTVSQANALLDADFLWYTPITEENSNTRILRTLHYTLPSSVASHINMIQPTTRFGNLHAQRSTMRSKPSFFETSRLLLAGVKAGTLDHCTDAITPSCLADLYNTEGYTADATRGSKVAFASFLEQYARYDDLAEFQEEYAPHAVGQNFSVVSFNNGLNDQSSTQDSGEANLDLQYIMGVSAPLPVTEFTTGGRGKLVPDLSSPDPEENSNEPYLEFLQGVLKLNNSALPQVISTSYGENEQTVPEGYARTVCNLYAQLGSRGVSVLFSSGDSGVGSSCATNDGTNKTHFMPQFPAACPWVTAVGATNGSVPEKGVYFSSGGFSDLWTRPAYQDAAVESYLQKLGGKQAQFFNRSGRAFPDVAAQGENFAVIDRGRMGLFDGTSASSPVFAAVVGLLNDVRLAAGLPVLGFLNPWLYKDGLRGLNDIVHGGSTGCDGNGRFGGAPNGSPVIPFASWNATEGWDPVTGLGTPDFARLRGIVLGAAGNGTVGVNATGVRRH
ncbi:peptidase S8/S53 domain-containing protein [Aspergillus karnatakaensis]|uniref:S53 family peptidase n=1 Tax=Aspergillus karnatakaensis TaxID=1810916 RepID=UPI003CCD6ADC